jgi:hypothetical protein
MKTVPIGRLVTLAVVGACLPFETSNAQSTMTYSPLTAIGGGPSGPASCYLFQATPVFYLGHKYTRACAY